MGFQLESGTGNGKSAMVNGNNQLEARTEAVDSSSIVSQRDERYFIWQSDYSASGNDYVLSITNTDTERLLKIRKVYLYNSGATSWEVHRVDAGTPAGTESTAENLSFGSGVTALSKQYGNAAVTGITSSTMMWSYTKGAADDHYLDANGAVIINTNNTLAIKTTGAGTIKVYVAGYFVDKD